MQGPISWGNTSCLCWYPCWTLTVFPGDIVVWTHWIKTWTDTILLLILRNSPPAMQFVGCVNITAKRSDYSCIWTSTHIQHTREISPSAMPSTNSFSKWKANSSPKCSVKIASISSSNSASSPENIWRLRIEMRMSARKAVEESFSTRTLD